MNKKLGCIKGEMSTNEPNFTGMTECQLAHYCQELILKDTPKRTPMLPTLGEASALSSQTRICDKGGGALCKDDITKFGFVFFSHMNIR